jgi:NADPH-dependent curcumin reductase CurA
MNETITRQIILAARPQGAVRPSDFRLEETALPKPGPGAGLPIR